MQPRNGRSRRDGGRSIVWSWWRCRSRWRDTGTWRDLLKSARRRLEARANCAILYTDNALMKHCPCPTPVDRCRPPRVSSLFLSLFLFVSFTFLFISCIRSRTRANAKGTKAVAKSCQRGEKIVLIRGRCETTSLFSKMTRGDSWNDASYLNFFSFFPVIDIDSPLSSIICVISMYISCRVEKSNIIG